MNALAPIAKDILSAAAKEAIIAEIQPKFPRPFSPETAVEVTYYPHCDEYRAIVIDSVSRQEAFVTPNGIYKEWAKI